MASLAVCFDVNNNPQDCSAASDAGGSSCFNNSQEVSCSEVGGYASPVTPSQVGATAAGGSIFGSSALSSIFSGLGQVGVAAVSQAAGVTKPPTTTLFGTGTSASSSTGIMLLLAALVVAFFAFGGAKKLSN